MKCNYCKGYMPPIKAFTSSFKEPIECGTCSRKVYLFRPASKLIGAFLMGTVPFLLVVYIFLRWDLLLVGSLVSISIWYIVFFVEYRLFGFTDIREPRYGFNGKGGSS